MFAAEEWKSVLRRELTDSNRLAWALALSMLLHLLIFGTYLGGRKLGIWDSSRWPSWLQNTRMITELLPKKNKPNEPKPDVPLIFVDVSPQQETTDPPKDSKFYSDRNSVAANPDADQDTGIPKITGEQTVVPKTIDIPKQVQPVTALQPSPPAELAQIDQSPLEARRVPPADLGIGTPDAPSPDQGKAPRRRPRTLRELAMNNPSQIAGQKMKQEGGVNRRLEISSLDVKASPFGAYDSQLITAISQRWHALLNERDYASDSRGKVVVHFLLHKDGRVTEVTVVENATTEMLALICQKAVLDPAPYAPWPLDMIRAFGDARRIQFTFYYY
jgi:outer membrane biosynthesis protein TonB